MSNNPTPPRIEREAIAAARLQFHPVYSPDAFTACTICYRKGANSEKERAAPVVKALERSIGIIESECDDQELITELKQILETYKSDV